MDQPRIQLSPVAPKFDQYRNKYKNVKLTREDGILTMTLHTGGGSLVWSAT